jgi:hypothetical protein
MDGWILLIIGLASLAVVLVALVSLGWRAYRLFRRGMAFSRTIAPYVAAIEASGRTLEVRTAQLERDAAALTASLDRLQLSVARLQVLAEAVNEGLAPYKRVRDYMAGG